MKTLENFLKKINIISVIILFLISINFQNVHAQCMWTGGISNDWGDSLNWSGNRIPVATDSVIIPSSVTYHPIIYDTGRVVNVLTVMPSAILRLNQFTSLTVNGTFTLSGTLVLWGRLTLCSTFILNSTLTSAYTINFSGSTMQTIPAIQIDSIIINNPLGVQLGGNLSVFDNISFVSGKIYLGNYNLTSSGNIIGNSMAKYIVTNGTGNLIQNLSSSTSSFILYPIGTTISYSPVSISISGGSSSGLFSARVSDSLSNYYTSFTPGTFLTSNAVNKTWFFSPGFTMWGSTSFTFKLQWNASDELPGFNRSSCYTSRYPWSAWSSTSSSATGSNPYTRTTPSYISSNLILGVGSGGTLPVTMINFKGSKNQNKIELTWETSSEINNDYFMIERSIDGINFELVNKVKGNGTSNIVHDYSISDDVLNLIQQKKLTQIFYRLSQVDINGKVNTGEIISVNIIDNSVNIVDVYPNPFNESFTVNYESKSNTNILIELRDITGRLISKMKNMQSLDPILSISK